MDHFLDFISSPSFLEDVAYGTKKLKLSDSETLEIPSVVRTVLALRLVQLYSSSCSETEFQPLGQSTLFNVLKISNLHEKANYSNGDLLSLLSLPFNVRFRKLSYLEP